MRVTPGLRAAAAVCRVTFTAAIRSRLLLSMSFIIALTLTVLHFTLKGDGSLTGHLTVLLRYSLSIAIGLTGVALMWTACASISQDIEDKHIQLTRVKPVPALSIWLGKWLGLMLVQMILVALAGVVTVLLIAVTMGNARHTTSERNHAVEQLLTGHHQIEPIETIGAAEIIAFIATRPELAESNIDPGSETWEEIRQHLKLVHNRVSPGESRAWEFVIPEYHSQPGPVIVQIRGITTKIRRANIDGVWRIFDEAGNLLAKIEMQHIWGGTQRVEFPNDAVTSGQKITLRFDNSRESEDTVVFDVYNGIKIRVPAAPFSINLISALLVVLCKLGLLAALGITLGTCFSFPVASFMSVSILFTVMLAGFFSFATTPEIKRFSEHEHHHHEHCSHSDPQWFNAFSGAVLSGIDLAAGPATALDPVGSLSEGIYIKPTETGKAIVILLGGYCVILWLAGAWMLSRRELALPER